MYCKLRIKKILAVSAVLLCLASVRAQQTAEKFIRETRYLLALPEGYDADTAKKWPLVIFLHGSGESGSDLEKVKVHGPPKLIAAGRKFPFILVSPQAQPPFGWEPDNLFHLITSMKQTYRVDNDRIYLTGLSMGGYGTWALAMKHPEEFAAIIPICGGGDTTDAWKLRHIPIWCFHGALDNVVSVEEDRLMVTAAQQYNPMVKFTVYPDANHNSWERTYNNDTVYQWLLAQKKFSYKQVNINSSALKAYIGKYVSLGRDTVTVVVENDTLKAKTNNQTFPLKPAGDHLFFIGEQLPVDLRFILDKKGMADSFLLLADRRALFRKI